MNQKTGPTKKKDFEYPRGPDVNDNKMRMRKSRLSNDCMMIYVEIQDRRRIKI